MPKAKRNSGSGVDLHIGVRKKHFDTEAEAYRYALDARRGGLHSEFAIVDTRTGIRREFTRAGKRRNPAKRNPEAAAVKMHEAFVGMPSKETIVVHEKVHVHEHLAALGELVQLKVKTIAGKYKGQTFVIDFDKTANPKKSLGKHVRGWIGRRAKTIAGVIGGVQKAWINPSRKRNPNGPVTLACSEDGRNLFCIGGNQTLSLDAVGLGSVANKESVVVGEIKTIDYFASKLWPGKKEPEVATYTHKFSEESGGPLPVLRYSTIDKLCYIDGGSFHIPKPLLGVSQGITD